MLEVFRPGLIAARLEKVDQEELLRRGICGLLLDLDNTLCPWGSLEISPARREWVERAKQSFRVCIISNTFKSRRLRRVGEELGVPTVARWGLGRKPMPGGIRAALKVIGTTPGETAIIGDQLFADITGGNRMGLLTVWLPVIDRSEFFTTRAFRGLERWVLRRLGVW